MNYCTELQARLQRAEVRSFLLLTGLKLRREQDAEAFRKKMNSLQRNRTFNLLLTPQRSSAISSRLYVNYLADPQNKDDHGIAVVGLFVAVPLLALFAN